MKLDIIYCPQCLIAHTPGEHISGRAPSQKSEVIPDRPAAGPASKAVTSRPRKRTDEVTASSVFTVQSVQQPQSSSESAESVLARIRAKGRARAKKFRAKHRKPKDTQP